MFYTYDWCEIPVECPKGVVFSSHNILIVKLYIKVLCNFLCCRIYVYKHTDTSFSSSVDPWTKLSKHASTYFLHFYMAITSYPPCILCAFLYKTILHFMFKKMIWLLYCYFLFSQIILTQPQLPQAPVLVL